MSSAPLLDITHLRVVYHLHPRPLSAVDDVSITIDRGERVGLVGESGSGKSSVAYAMTGLLRAPGEVTGGSVRLEGDELIGLPESRLNRVRGSRLSLIYQDPFTFLDPVMRVGDQVAEALWAHGQASRADGRARAADLLERLGLTPGRAFAARFPHQLSGGQRQRVVIAMAVVGEPRLIVADEPTSALVVTVQAQILRLLARVVHDLGSSLLLISHDLAVMATICDRVYVMYAGQIVESGPSRTIFATPKHPYTRALVAAARRPTGRDELFSTIPGTAPDLRRPPVGCRFANRCAHRFARCADEPPLAEAGDGSLAACWLHVPEA
jgi:oligopeptide/dipeptide ABC transporter ATP-binding protein